ncbi:hypothetical protein E4T39_02470 [Aureobasidium subglaciale]|nr:hypothetical protein E4T39_02470 [Aureobasidium subglaciale]
MWESFRNVLRDLDQYSADLHFRFYTASLMLHEFTTKEAVHEPFINDGRVAEISRALRQALRELITKPSFWKKEPERFGITQSMKLSKLLGVD